VKDPGVPGRETSISRRLCAVGVAGFGQLFNSRGKILSPVIFCGRIPDVLLRLSKSWHRVDRHEFIAAADQEITGMKVTVEEHGAIRRALAAPDGICKGYDSILMPTQ
jgi:hypothetical protein